MNSSKSEQTARRVLVVGSDLEGPVRAALPQASIETGSKDRLTSDLPAGKFDLLVVDGSVAHPQLLASLIERMAEQPNPPATILAADAAPASLLRAMLRLQASDIIEPPFEAKAIAESAERLFAAAAPKPQQAVPAPVVQNRCWAVTSAVGGAGATTIAIELATAVARLERNAKVCLIDLNLADGACAPYLGATANMNIDPATLTPSRIDASMLDIMTSKPSDQIDLLAAPRNPLAFEKADPEAVLKILDTACQIYSHVVVDMPRLRKSWTLPLLGGCDDLMIVSELTVPALLATRAMAEELESELTTGPRPQIILNRLASRMFGPAPSMSEAEKALGRSADAGVSSDWEAAAASVNLGGSISEHRPKSKIVRDIEALAKSLLAEKGSAGRQVA